METFLAVIVGIISVAVMILLTWQFGITKTIKKEAIKACKEIATREVQEQCHAMRKTLLMMTSDTYWSLAEVSMMNGSTDTSVYYLLMILALKADGTDKVGADKIAAILSDYISKHELKMGEAYKDLSLRLIYEIEKLYPSAPRLADVKVAVINA